MKLAEIYANVCGVKLPSDPVTPYMSYYPILGEYITIHNGSGMDSKNYGYYQQVIDIIKSEFKKQGLNIKFVQIGTQKEPLLEGVVDLRGKTNLYQCNFVISQAKLHLGNDSVWVHNAGSLGIPVVALYGPTLSQSCKPYYHTENSIFVDSQRGGRATHSPFENPKTINLIKPEEVANSVLQVLGLNESNHKTLFIGEDFNTKLLEIVPDSFERVEEFDNHVVNIRLDLGGIYDYIPLVTRNKKFHLVISEALSQEQIINIKENLLSVTYMVVGNFDINIVKTISQLGVDYQIVLKDSSNLEDVKFELLDFQSPRVLKSEQKPVQLDWIGKSFDSCKRILSDGKIYLTESCLHAKISASTEVKVREDLSKELNCLYIYEKGCN